MEVKELSENLGKVLDGYAQRFAIERSPDWYMIKIQEELGELSSAYLKLTSRARISGNEELQKNFEEEIADVIAMTMLFARDRGIDVEKAIKEKWFKYL